MNQFQGPPQLCRVDHLVVAAASLAQGAAWCEATLGVVPQPGGRHALMGTHNLLLRIGAPAWPQAYLEIIAIDPLADAPPARAYARWFDLDAPSLRAALAQAPLLVHFVAQTADIAGACAALAAIGEDVGRPVAASRASPEGEVRWQISVRKDGRPQHHGALPALIEWQGPHPSASMRETGVRLRELLARSDHADALRAAHVAIGLTGVRVALGERAAPALEARLSTPLGIVTLHGADREPEASSPP